MTIELLYWLSKSLISSFLERLFISIFYPDDLSSLLCCLSYDSLFSLFFSYLISSPFSYGSCLFFYSEERMLFFSTSVSCLGDPSLKGLKEICWNEKLFSSSLSSLIIFS